MALEVVWSPLAKEGPAETVRYLEEKWTSKEIMNLEEKINKLILQIIQFPESCPRSSMRSKYHEAIVDKNNFFVYAVNTEKGHIEIVDFGSTRQFPNY